MSSSLYGMQGLGSNGLGVSAGGGNNTLASLLALLSQQSNTTGGAQSGLSMSPLSMLANTPSRGLPSAQNPVVQPSPLAQQNTSSSGSGLSLGNLTSLLSALGGTGGATGLGGLSTTGQNTPTTDISSALMTSPATTGIGTALANAPASGTGSTISNLGQMLQGASPVTTGIGTALTNSPISSLRNSTGTSGMLGGYTDLINRLLASLRR